MSFMLFSSWARLQPQAPGPSRRARGFFCDAAQALAAREFGEHRVGGEPEMRERD